MDLIFFVSDLNECFSNCTCGTNSTCTNTIGSYSCSCKPGLTGDGENCTGIRKINDGK